MLDGGHRQVRHDVEGVTAARSPAGNGRDDDLGHRADESLDLQDVQAPGARRVDLLAPLRGGRLRVRPLDLVAVPITASDPLVPARTERVAAVARRRAVARQDDGRDRRGLARVVERPVQLVDRARTEGVTNVGAIKGNAHDRHVRALGATVGRGAARNPAVVGDVSEVESLNLTPAGRVEGVGDKRKSTHASDSNGRGRGGLSAPGRVSQSAGEGGGGPRVQPGRSPARLRVAPGGKLTARNDRKARGCLDGDN